MGSACSSASPLAALSAADAAKLRLEGRTQKEVEDEARRTGVVPRALGAKLLLETVTGTLRIDRDGDRVVRARIEADAEEEYVFLASEDHRGGIQATRIRKCSRTFAIPAEAGRFALVQPCMAGKRVEAQFMLARPPGDTGGALRYLGVLQGPRVSTPDARPAPPRKARAPGGATYFVAPTGSDQYRRWGNPEYVKITGTKLNPTLLTRPSFTDTTLDRKGKFYYVVEAVGARGIPSYETTPVLVTVE